MPSYICFTSCDLVPPNQVQSESQAKMFTWGTTFIVSVILKKKNEEMKNWVIKTETSFYYPVLLQTVSVIARVISCR